MTILVLPKLAVKQQSDSPLLKFKKRIPFAYRRAVHLTLRLAFHLITLYLAGRPAICLQYLRHLTSRLNSRLTICLQHLQHFTSRLAAHPAFCSQYLRFVHLIRSIHIKAKV